MSPWIVGFSIFFGYPLVMSVYLSFTHYDLLSPPRWVGLGNYRYMFGSDPQVWPAIRNTLWIIAVGVPLQVLFAFGVAVMLARAKQGAGFFRTVFYLPALAPPVAATLGFVYLLTILDVPKQLYESAHLDGAGWFQRLRWVTLPSVSPVILFAVVIGVIQGLQYFTQAYVAANVAAGQASQAGSNENTLGYPENSTLFYPVLLYQHGFRYFNMGYASAMAIVLLGVAFAITLLIIVNSRRWVHYQGTGR